MQTVLITGASGLIGNRLTELLLEKAYRVIHLGRAGSYTPPHVECFTWDLTKETIEHAAVEQADYIIHLAGESISAKRWSKAQKQKIIESRVKGTALLAETIKKTASHPKAFITAAAIGYYGAVTSNFIYTETDLPGSDFLATTCIAWEGAADRVSALAIRTVKIRTALVLSAKGGALAKMAKPIKYFLGSPLGTGRQYMPWIHIDDLCAIYIKAIEDDRLHGAYNAVAPEHITNRAFTFMLAKQLHKPVILPAIPAFAIKLIMGDMACMVLEGSRISSEKISHTGFHFTYPTLEQALSAIYIK